MELTGKWYLKKTLFGYKVMVQVKTKHTLSVYYKKATTDDIADLGIGSGQWLSYNKNK